MADPDELTDLKRKLAARTRAGGGYGPNIEALKARISELEDAGDPRLLPTPAAPALEVPPSAE